MTGPVWTLHDATCRRGSVDVLAGVELQITAGRLVVMVGPNGAGKSTLLGVLAGDLPLRRGSVRLDGRELKDWDPGDLSRRRAVLTQDHDVSFGFTVREVVAMGRYPWTSRSDVEADDQRIATALEQTVTMHLADRTFRTLSGGEKARVSLARVLAQDTELVLLDEPTAALDLRHTEEILGLARRLVVEEGRTVLVVAHDLSLASAYADELIVVDRGGVTAHGSAADVLTPDLIQQTYSLTVEVHRVRDRLVVVPAGRAGPERP